MKRLELDLLHQRSTAVPGKIYTDEFGVSYKGTLKGRLERISASVLSSSSTSNASSTAVTASSSGSGAPIYPITLIPYGDGITAGGITNANFSYDPTAGWITKALDPTYKAEFQGTNSQISLRYSVEPGISISQLFVDSSTAFLGFYDYSTSLETALRIQNQNIFLGITIGGNGTNIEIDDSTQKIFLEEGSLGAASNGDVWTLIDNTTGEGAWVVGGGGGSAPIYPPNEIVFGDGGTAGGTTSPTFTWNTAVDDLTAGGTIQLKIYNSANAAWIAQGNVGYWYTGPTSTGLLAHQGFGIDMKTSEIYTMGAVGLGNGNYIEVDDTSSQVTVTTLAGAGTRMVTADAAGVLNTTAIPAAGLTASGPPANTQLAYWTSATNLTGSAGLTFNSGTNTLTTTTFVGALTGNASTATSATTATTATNATNVAVTATNTNASFPVTFVSATSGNLPINADSAGFTYNPSTNVLTVGSISGTVNLQIGTTTISSGSTGRILYESSAILQESANMTYGTTNGLFMLPNSTSTNAITLKSLASQTAPLVSFLDSTSASIGGIYFRNTEKTVMFSTVLNTAADPSGVAIPTSASFGYNYSVGNFYGTGVGLIRNGFYDVWFQTGSVNGGGYRWYCGDNNSTTVTERMTLSRTGFLSIGAATTPTAVLHLKAGTATASTAPIKFTSGTSLTAVEAGTMEFTTDDLFFSITTGPARKRILMADPTAGLTSGRVPYSTTNGRLTDSSTFTFNGTQATLTTGTFTFTTASLLTFTNSVIEECQGTDIASANSLTLNSDGNTMSLTGGTTLQEIDTTDWQNGSKIVLFFDTNTQVDHGSSPIGSPYAPIYLNGSTTANMTPGSSLHLVLGITNGRQAWYEIGRSIL